MKLSANTLVCNGCIVLSVSFLLATEAVPVRASDFCSSINHLIEQFEPGFDESVAKSNQTASDSRMVSTHFQASNCNVLKSPSGSSYHCVWNFPLQSQDAGAKFREIGGKLQECFGHRATMHRDQSVNHPDFYESHRFELASADVTVSLKDKSELQSTLVNLRVKPNKR